MKISLLENAYDFLEESLSNAITSEREEKRWKHAILNLVQAIELSLKEKLRREHPILVFRNVDKPRVTVDLVSALSRLKEICKVQLSEADITAILKASGIRNKIVHYEFTIDVTESKVIYSKLLGFLSHFHLRHLDEALDQKVEPELWQQALAIFDYADELYSRALVHFEERGVGEESIWRCPSCEWDAFVTHEEENVCYVCGHQDQITECAECGTPKFRDECRELQTGDERYESFCFECYETRIREDERHYHEMMSYFWNK